MAHVDVQGIGKIGPRLDRTMQHQCSEQARTGGAESPQAALLSMLEAARVALVELSAHIVCVDVMDLVREALLQVEDLADYRNPCYFTRKPKLSQCLGWALSPSSNFQFLVPGRL